MAGIGRDDQDHEGAPVPGAGADGVHGPGEALDGVGGELSFNDDPEDGCVVGEEHDGVGAVLGGHEVVEGGLGEAGGGVVGHGDVQEPTQQAGCEGGILAHKGEDSLVEERRHRGDLPSHRPAILRGCAASRRTNRAVAAPNTPGARGGCEGSLFWGSLSKVKVVTNKRALITGITGQDGSYLSELLLAKGYEVHGIVRRASTFNTERLEHLYRDPHETGTRLFLHYGDLGDGTGLRRILEKVRPDEVYNLGAQSHVRVSFDQPEYTADAVATGTLRLLEALRDFKAISGSTARFYQASSSEMFGSAAPPQGEATPFHPRSPYAVSKVAAHWYAINYREAYGMFIASGILFNHESPRRGETFVSRKVTRAVARIKLGLQKKLYHGQPRSQARLGVRGGLRRGDVADAAGRASRTTTWWRRASRTRCASSSRWRSGTSGSEWQEYVEVDPRYFRPAEVDHLLRRCDEGAEGAGLGAEGEVRGARADDGGRRSGAGAPGEDAARRRARPGARGAHE